MSIQKLNKIAQITKTVTLVTILEKCCDLWHLFKKMRFAHDLKPKRIYLVRYGTLRFPSTDAAGTEYAS